MMKIVVSMMMANLASAISTVDKATAKQAIKKVLMAGAAGVAQANDCSLNADGDFVVAPGATGDVVCFGDTGFSSVRNLVVENTGIKSLNIQELNNVNGNVSLKNNTNMETLLINGIENIGGDFVMDGNANQQDPLELPSLTRVGGDFTVTNNAKLDSAFTPAFERVGDTAEGGSFTLEGNDNFKQFTLSSLSSVNGGVKFSNNAQMFEVGVPSLTTVNGDIEVSEMPRANQFQQFVQNIPGNFIVKDNPIMFFVGLGETKNVDGNFVIQNTDAGGEFFNTNALETVGGDFVFDNNNAATFVSFLTSVGGDITYAGNSKNGDRADFQSLESLGGKFNIENNPALRQFNLNDNFDTSNLGNVEGNLDGCTVSFGPPGNFGVETSPC